MTPFEHPFDDAHPDAFDPTCPCSRCVCLTESARHPAPQLDDLPNHIRALTVAIRDVQSGVDPWPDAPIAEAVDTWSVRDLLRLMDAIETHVLLGLSSMLVIEMSAAWDRRDRAAMFAPTSPVFRLGRVQWMWGRLRLLREQMAARLDDDA